jgi:hypothetical protein
MSSILKLIKALASQFKSQKEIDDAYLAQASDVHDLERRMRDIEIRNRWASRGQLPAWATVMEHTFQYPQGLAKAAADVGRTSELAFGLPFDVARETYAKAVRLGLIEDSMLGEARFEQHLCTMEKLFLGPWARRVWLGISCARSSLSIVSGAVERVAERFFRPYRNCLCQDRQVRKQGVTLALQFGQANQRLGCPALGMQGAQLRGKIMRTLVQRADLGKRRLRAVAGQHGERPLRQGITTFPW